MAPLSGENTVPWMSLGVKVPGPNKSEMQAEWTLWFTEPIRDKFLDTFSQNCPETWRVKLKLSSQM